MLVTQMDTPIKTRAMPASVDRLTPRVSPSSWLVTVVKRKVSELVIGTTKDISALPRDQKNTTEPHMLSRNGTRYCATHNNLNLKSRIARLCQSPPTCHRVKRKKVSARNCMTGWERFGRSVTPLLPSLMSGLVQPHSMPTATSQSEEDAPAPLPEREHGFHLHALLIASKKDE